VPFDAPNGHKKYCPPCAAAHKRQVSREWARRSKGVQPRPDDYATTQATCEVCGAEFRCPPSRVGDVKTCGNPECVRECRARITRDRSAELEPVRLAGLAASPKTGRFSSNVNANGWTLLDPDGVTYDVINLRNWCRENEDILPGTAVQAYNGLYRVKSTMLHPTRKFAVWHWRGWKIIGCEDLPNRKGETNDD